MDPKRELLLSSYKILDLTDEKGFFCSKILADLGADVIKIERPGGDASRNIGPYYHSVQEGTKSLYWFAYNACKRGITLNIECLEGKEIFKKLVQIADVVVESFHPGYMAERGLAYDTLRNINPKIILTSISPFGQEGPYKDFTATDLVVMAMGGWTYLCGEADRPPIALGFPQSYLTAAGDAAMGTVVALYHREKSGQGQHVEISAQQSVLQDAREGVPYWFLCRTNIGRSSPYRVGFAKAGVRQRWLWECKDGFIIWMATGGKSGARENRALVQWMDMEGKGTEFLKEMNWEQWDIQQATVEFFDTLEKDVGSFFLGHTKAELYDGALKKDIILYPVSTISDLMNNVQLKARNFWVEVDHPELKDRITYPGDFVRLSKSTLQERFRAPLIGEHNTEVYGEMLGFSAQHIIELRKNGVI